MTKGPQKVQQFFGRLLAFLPFRQRPSHESKESVKKIFDLSVPRGILGVWHTKSSTFNAPHYTYQLTLSNVTWSGGK